MLLQFDADGKPYYLVTQADRDYIKERWEQHRNHPLLTRLDAIQAVAQKEQAAETEYTLLELMDDIWYDKLPLKATP